MKNSNEYSWNQTLKFSWGHIIAFLALIFMSYVMYMGDFYANGGDFQAACIKVGIIDLLLLFVFMGAQRFKAADSKFAKKIIFERMFIILCPIVFAVAMVPYNHFWSVFEQRDDIETQFTESINSVRNLFDKYETYSNDRIAAVIQDGNDWLKRKKEGLDSSYTQCEKRCTSSKKKCEAACNSEYKSALDSLSRASMVVHVCSHALTLQLLSENTDSLRNKAVQWIDEANQGASVWNAFLVGNIDVIADAVTKWHESLRGFSIPVFFVENSPKPFDVDGKTINYALERIDALKSIYQETTGVKVNAIWSGLILFFMLLFPYVIQRRNTKAAGYYFLIPRGGAKRYEEPKGRQEKENSVHDKNVEEKNKLVKKDEIGDLSVGRPSVAPEKTKPYDDRDPFSGTF